MLSKRRSALLRRAQLTLPLAILWIGLTHTAGTVNASSPEAPLPTEIRFNRDIRPILSDNCFACHGPDAKTREADLRLDTEEGALADLGGHAAVVPGFSSASELIRRITDPIAPMPPDDFDKTLTERQIQLLTRWVEEGAKWQPHWSFIPADRPKLPEADETWCRNPIDRFVIKELEHEGLAPSPEADKTTLIRRVTLDLTGLPPTPEEVEAFLADESPDAYEKVVDRLLASPHHAERLAVPWLDLSRYADTHGYHIDSHRDMWRWRDWVIESLAENKPYDEFTVEQLAGDLLPNATMKQRLATGFNRNHMINYEGGAIPEEYLTQYIKDRVNTTSTVWLGLTMECAQCHDHKYDPFTMKDYYRLFAFFNNVPEKGLDGHHGNADPVIRAPLPDQKTRLEQVRTKLAAAEKTMADLEPELAAAMNAWTQRHLETTPDAPRDGLVAHYEFDGHASDTSGHYRHGKTHGDVAYENGKLDRAIKLNGKSYIDAGETAGFERTDAFSYGGWVHIANGNPMVLLSRMDESNGIRGYDLYASSGLLFVHLIHHWPDNVIRVNTKKQMPLQQWQHVMMTYDGSGKADGVRIYVNGEPQELTVTHNTLTKSIRTDRPLHIGRRTTSDPFVGSIDDVRIYARLLTAAEVKRLAVDHPFRSILATAPSHRSAEQNKQVRERFLAHHAPEKIKTAYDHLLAMRKQEADLVAEIPTSMVMGEQEERRKTFVLVRGQYDSPGEEVFPNVPESLGALPEDAAGSRLGLARWIASGDNPLTARVAVNRYWQMYFGTGIVKTSEDFGVQGEWPTHPELLDWLATEFVESGWDIRHIQRLIVTSATYRQASKVTPALLEKDPQNRLLTRGPRFRLTAEFIRDNALAVGGLLDTRIGGPSVSPYQPPGLWKEVAYGEKFTAQEYKQDHGTDLYRRSIYTFWKRTVPPPGLATFDAPDREFCIARRSRTNTPLQALVLLNDKTYVEAARKFAERILDHDAEGVEARVRFAFRAALAREPKPQEVQILASNYRRQVDRYATDVTAAFALISQGEANSPTEVNAIELAAWTTVASMILNLDEMVTKP